jgi:hypothetical protein
MLEWKEAVPLISVIFTGFLGITCMFGAKLLQGQAATAFAIASGNRRQPLSRRMPAARKWLWRSRA